MNNVQGTLKQRTARSAQMARALVGAIRLELVTPDIGRPSYRAATTWAPERQLTDDFDEPLPEFEPYAA